MLPNSTKRFLRQVVPHLTLGLPVVLLLNATTPVMTTAAYAVVPAQNKHAQQTAAWDLECSIVNNNTPNKDDYKVNIHLSFNNTDRLNENDISIIYTDHA